MRNAKRETAFQEGVRPFRNAVSSLSRAGQGLLDDILAAEEYLQALTEELPLVRFSPLSPLSEYPFSQEETGAGPARGRPSRRVDAGGEGSPGNPRRPNIPPQSRSSGHHHELLPMRETDRAAQGHSPPARPPVFSLRRDDNRGVSRSGSPPASQCHPASLAETSERARGLGSDRETPGINAGYEHIDQSQPPAGERPAPSHSAKNGQPLSGASWSQRAASTGPSAAGTGTGQPLDLLNTLADSMLDRWASPAGRFAGQTRGAGPGAPGEAPGSVGERRRRAAWTTGASTFRTGAGGDYPSGQASPTDGEGAGGKSSPLAGSRASRSPMGPGQSPVSALKLIDSLVEQLWSPPQASASVPSYSLEQRGPLTEPEGRLPLADNFPGLDTDGLASAARSYLRNVEEPSGATHGDFAHLRNGRVEEDEGRVEQPDMDTVIATLTSTLIEEARRHGVDLS